jgi:SRSO17 transposase
MFEIFKPKERLKEIEVERNGKKIKQKEKYKTKIEIAREMIEEIVRRGFKIKVVLADSEYGEATEFRRTLEELKLKFVLAIRSNHTVLLPNDQYVRYNKWKEFNREFSNGEKELRYIREIVYGKRNPNHTNRYYILTTDKETLPQQSTYYIMTNLEGKIDKTVGNIYGLRTWIEYGLKQSKNQLGWADFRFTDYPNIERWWEFCFCAYLLVSLQSSCFRLNRTSSTSPSIAIDTFRKHPRCDHSLGWKNLLNNLRLIIQPYIFLPSQTLAIYFSYSFFLSFFY